MGLMLAKATIDVRAGTSKLKGDLRKSKAPLTAIAQNITATLTKVFATIGIGVGIGALIGKLRQALPLAEAQIHAEQRMQAVLKATAGIVGYNAKQLREMASAFQVKTTFGDEEVLKLQAVLLTFKSITGPVFKETIGLSLDLASVLGTDAKGAALQLGKALEDPITGLTSLRRAGVSFTDSQKEQIKSLVESGRLLTAQNIILAELQTQFGGVAEAMSKTPAGKLQQLRNTLGDLYEEVGKKLIPIAIRWKETMISVVGTISKYLPHIQAAFQMWYMALKSRIELIQHVFKVAVDYINSLFPSLASNFKSTFSTIVSYLDGMLASWKGLRTSMIHVGVQVTLSLKAAWVDFVDWWKVKITEMRAFFELAWLDWSKESVKQATPALARFFIWIENQQRKLQGKPLIGEEETAIAIESTLKTVYAELGAARLEVEKRTNDALEVLRKKHETRLAALGQKSLEASKAYEKTMSKLPTLSGIFNKLVKDATVSIDASLNVPAAAAPAPNVPALASPKASRGVSRVGIEDYSKRLQEAMSQRSKPEEKIAANSDKQVALLAKIEARGKPKPVPAQLQQE